MVHNWIQSLQWQWLKPEVLSFDFIVNPMTTVLMYVAVRRNSELVILNVATLLCYNPQLFASSNKFHHFWTLKSSGLTITKMSTRPILRLNQSYTKHCHLGQTSHWRWHPSGKEEWPLLVVAPSSLRFVWRDQVWESVEFDGIRGCPNSSTLEGYPIDMVGQVRWAFFPLKQGSHQKQFFFLPHRRVEYHDLHEYYMGVSKK